MGNLTALPKGQEGQRIFACVTQAVPAAVACEASGQDGRALIARMDVQLAELQISVSGTRRSQGKD